MSAPTTTTAPTFEYEFHPLANIFPMLKDKDFTDLANDIERRGLIDPIVVYEGKILDGRNRYEAARLVKLKFTEQCFRQLPPEMNPEAFVIGANIHRRHLTAEQKRDLIAKLIKADPAKSDRQIAEAAKVDHKTVGAVRKDGEATGEIPQLENRQGKDGKTRKAKTGKAKKEKVKVRGSDWAAYHVIQERLIDALREWPSSSDHALEWANKTRERLDQTIDDWCEREAAEEETEEAA
jgi:ParB-like chromosome segregation protein Spo0J